MITTTAVCRDLETKYNLQKATKQEQKQTDKIFKKVEQQKGNIKSQIASVVRHLPKHYQYTSIGTYNALLSFLNITAEEIKGERNEEPLHGLLYFALNDKGEKVSNPFKGKHAGINGLQQHFEQSKEKMKTNPARSVLKNAVELAIHTTDNEREFKKQLAEQNIHTVVRRNDSRQIYSITFIDNG